MRPVRLSSSSILLVGVLSASCGSRSPAAERPAPTGPAPSLAKQDTSDGDFAFSFVASGLPAVTADAANVALAVMDETGPVSAPNLLLSVRDRTDAQVHQIVVLTAAQGEAYLGGSEDAPPFDDTALVEANRYLGETHAQRGWFTLAEMTLDEPAEDSEDTFSMSQGAHSGAVALAWNGGAIKVTVDGKVVVERQTQGWLAAPTPPPADCEDCGGCSNPSYVGKAWLDAARKLIVVRIAYYGTDSCWEPPPQDHVVAWE